MKRSEKNGDRARASRAGPVDADEGVDGAIKPSDRGHERERTAVSTTPGSQPGTSRVHHRRSAASPALRRGHDSPQAPSDGRVRQLQACRATVCAGDAAYSAAAAQEDPMADRQPLLRPGTTHEVWSMDFAFDQVASDRTLK